MNILMVHPHDLFDSSEPWTTRIKNIAREFVKHSHKVKICYFPLVINGDHRPSSIDSIDLIPLKRVPSPRAFIINTIRLTRLSRWADIVHFQKCHHYASIPAVIAAYISARPLHYDWDDWEEMIWYESCGRGMHSRFIGFSFNVLERFLPVLSDTVSVASQALRDLTSGFGIDKENIYPASVGADLEKFRPDIDGNQVRIQHNIKNPMVLYLGQLHGAQYIDLLIRAANVVLHKNNNVTFMIVGEGFMEGPLRKLAYELGINHKVIFTGSVPHNKIPEYIAAADICIAPFRDTKVTRCKSPLKIVEYMASGKAIIASNVGEVRRMLGGVGVLVDPGNFHSLAEEILRLLGDKNLRDKLGKFSRQRAESSYNWQVTASNLLRAYNKLIN